MKISRIAGSRSTLPNHQRLIRSGAINPSQLKIKVLRHPVTVHLKAISLIREAAKVVCHRSLGHGARQLHRRQNLSRRAKLKSLAALNLNPQVTTAAQMTNRNKNQKRRCNPPLQPKTSSIWVLNQLNSQLRRVNSHLHSILFQVV